VRNIVDEYPTFNMPVKLLFPDVRGPNFHYCGWVGRMPNTKNLSPMLSFQIKSSMESGMNKPRSAYPWIIASQYFLYFGGMGVFLPYFNLYCHHIGFSGAEIGALSALKSISTVIVPLFISLIADRSNLRRPIYIFCTFASAGIWCFFLLTTNFAWMFAIMLFYGIFYAPIISFLEALTIDTLGGDKQSYGTVRAWGSVSFILTVVFLGKLIDRLSVNIILLFMLIVSALQAVNAISLPRPEILEKKTTASGLEFFLQKKILIFLFCSFLMLASHGAYYGFFSIHLENLGYSNAFIGMAWALASIAEIGAMVKSKAIFKRFSLESVLVGSFAVAAARWLLLARATTPAAIILTQTLHAVTYGTFHMACILYIDQNTPPNGKNMGQAVNNGVGYGLGLMAGFFFSGFLYERIGAPSLFLISAVIALTGGLLFGGSVWITKFKAGR
jgi:MFS transporter, PPP family, 3-phenylpropionic acid transporter